jgi:predicted house-cleaning noncanonical NTP pyrophosphatase (MazG superfamily)
MKKKGQLNRDEIVKELVNLGLVEKYSQMSLLNHVKEKYGYKESYSYELLREAREYIAKVYKESLKDILEKQFAELEEQLQTAKKDKNRKLILEITKEINKICGLHKEKVDISGRIETDVRIIKLIKKVSDE